MGLIELDVRMWSGFSWLRIGSGGVLIRTVIHSSLPKANDM